MVEPQLLILYSPPSEPAGTLRISFRESRNKVWNNPEKTNLILRRSGQKVRIRLCPTTGYKPRNCVTYC
ncbi:hypothetical protein BN2364_1957 [Alloalcanivorax xenomutans]|nr:hypothetical protein BN2364_1957 [Alloalcanivorax xenomutans]